MKLWLTRDNDGNDDACLWSGDRPHLIDGIWDGDTWVADEVDADCEPGTCTRLYTEQEMRRRAVDVAAATARDGAVAVLCRLCGYRENPTDANWQRLADAVWPGGNDAVDDNPTPAR